MQWGANMVSIYLHKEKEMSPTQIMQLYQDAGWWPERNEKGIDQILNSSIAVGAWDGEQLVGFCRAISDGVYRAYIEDVVVLQSHRNQGIGKLLMNRLQKELKEIDIVSLFCSADLENYYQQFRYKATKQIVMHQKNGDFK